MFVLFCTNCLPRAAEITLLQHRASKFVLPVTSGILSARAQCNGIVHSVVEVDVNNKKGRDYNSYSL